MDAGEFDQLTKSLSRLSPRRVAMRQFAALAAIVTGLALADEDEATAGLHHRRRVRNRHDHDNRKGKRKDHARNNRAPGSGSPLDCRNRPDGTPCDNIGGLYQLRCCQGVCPKYRSCVPRGEIVPVSCSQQSDCSGHAGACCSGEIMCDTTFESACMCLPSVFGDPCVSDHDCSGQCLCGRCR
ncbi:MAG: hypothetical protein U0031_11485 [Thermomicrobiales bacterium]